MSDKLDLKSPDLVNQNIQKIAALFPNCITETAEGKAIDFDLLKQELNHEIVEGSKERYRLEWPGKREAIVTANLPTTNTLRPVPEESVNFDTTENLYIEGNNLEVLKLLQESYLGKIKMIYIDPPYNTGNDFVYKDNFMQDSNEFKADSGLIDDQGNRLVPNPETSGRYHSNWLTMMYPRLKLARNLLTDDGVIFISIDDNEAHNLKKVCDEVFGEENFVNCISVNMKNIAGASGGGEDRRLKKNIEYILLYTKGYSDLVSFENVYNYIPVHELVESYRQEDKSWKYSSVLFDKGEKNFVGSTVDGEGNEIKIFSRENPVFKSINQLMKEENITEEEAYKKYSDKAFQTQMPQSSIRPRIMKKVKELRLNYDFYSIEYVPKSGRNKGEVYEQFYKGDNFRLLAWLYDVSEEIDGILNKKEIQGTYWDYASETKNLSKEGNISFPNGKKPLAMINRMLKMLNGNDFTVLDFFSGSATTAHAVMQLNAEDGGTRKFIMVQLPEKTDENSEAFNDGLKNICEIGKVRICRAGKKIQDELAEKTKSTPEKTLFDDHTKSEFINAELDFGFRVYKLDSSNMQDVYYRPQDYKPEMMDMFADNIKPDRTPRDLLAQVMLDWGLPLSYRIEELPIDGKQVFRVAQNSLLACFDNGINEVFAKELATHSPLRVVFRDRSFANDTAKENVRQLLKQLSPETEMRVI